MKHLLVPLDGSELACQLFDRIAPLLPDARVTLLSVVDPITPRGEMADPSSHEQTMRELAEPARAKLEAQGVEVEMVTRVGDPVEEIVEHAARCAATHIAMSTHGRTGLSRWLLGSVTEQVLRTTKLPLLVSRAFDDRGQPKGTEPYQWNKVLIPCSGDKRSHAVFRPLLAMLGELQPTFTLLEVKEFQNHETPNAKTQAELVTARDALAGLGVDPARIEMVAAEGDPAVRTLELAVEREMDLIALATTTGRGLARLLLGSTAERVVRHANRPVFVVRSFD